jgi:L-fucose mutarotase/ribose pyranase (RbsD/FucU family)
MLKGIDPLLSPQLLQVLSSMGHRHEIAIVDANYACDPDRANVVRLDGISVGDVLYQSSGKILLSMARLTCGRDTPAATAASVVVRLSIKLSRSPPPFHWNPSDAFEQL